MPQPETHIGGGRMISENEALFRSVFDNAPIGMALFSLDGRWLKINRALCDIVGHTPDELLATTIQQLTHPDDLAIDQTFVQMVLADQLKTYQMETRYFHKQGHVVPVMLSASLARDADGKPLYFIARIEDITLRKKTEDALFAEKDLAQTTLQSIGDAVITTDAAGLITYLNPVAERLTGWSNQEASGLPLDHAFVIVHEATREPVENPVAKVIGDGRVVTLASSTILIARDGFEYNIDNSAAPIRVRDGTPNGVVIVFHDVTEARALSHKISYQASHDALTGLYNRSEFELAAVRLLHSAKVMHHQHCMLYMDLDQFKVVNDTCGHIAGDQLLRQLSNLLLNNTRKSDTLARLGGDEFGILLERCPPDRAQEIAQNLIDVVRAFRFEWEQKLFSVGASVGLVTITERTRDIQSIFRCADAACYAAKETGRNRVHVGTDCDRLDTGDQAAQMDWVARLQQALEQGLFSFFFQRITPIRNAASPQHYEILLRYKDEQGRLLLPMAFIPSAERYGLLPAIDRWVVGKLLRNMPALPFTEGAFIAINLSSASIADPGFQEFVLQTLRSGSIPPDRICFEINETAAISNLHRTVNFMQALKASGCRFALDDFGSGLGSFSYLKSLPVDYLKIDGGIIKGIGKNAVDCAIVESIHRIAQVMGVKTIGKFIEHQDILPQLERIGIDYGQGFEIHMPELLTFSDA